MHRNDARFECQQGGAVHSILDLEDDSYSSASERACMSASPSFLEHLRQSVVRRYGARADEVRVVRSPYRICPLGAHIDHQLGPVTAMAIDRGVLLAYAPSTDGEVRLSSREFAGEVRFRVGPSRVPHNRGDWGNYARGAVQALTRKGHPLSRGIGGCDHRPPLE